MRWLSFRFDDGMLEGALKSSAILEPDTASYYIITGLVEGTVSLDYVEAFRGKDFGTIDDWRRLSQRGHDIQPHGDTHADLSTLDTVQQMREIERSLAVVRQIHSGPFVFCAPFNRQPRIDLGSLGFSGAGFTTLDSAKPIIFNRMDEKMPDRFRLLSWAVREEHYQDVVGQLSEVPEGTWTILAFHSLDGEGWAPWSSDGFSKLVDFVRKQNFSIKTVSHMVDQRLPQRFQQSALESKV